MSVDTRTPRTPDPSGRRPGDTPRGSPSGFFEDEPVLGSVKVPSDPAQVIVSHASFRVRLGTPPAPSVPLGFERSGAMEDTEPLPAMTGLRYGAGATPVPAGTAPGVSGAGAGAGAGAVRTRRRAPVVWSGRTHTRDGEAGATELLQAVRFAAGPAAAGPGHAGEPSGPATRLLPRVGEGVPPGASPGTASPTVVGPRAPQPPERAGRQPRLLDGVRPASGAFDEAGADEFAQPSRSPDGDTGPQPLAPSVVRRQAYYPGRRMNLGVVLLPLRVFLGFISVYAGMGKLCDPVYFDGGERGSMVAWLRSLHPWSIASPLRDFALEHPVGAGLTVAFLQVIVGVLTMCGLWQRLAASIGTMLSAALLMTVSWSTVPAYDAPDIIYLAAWSPLIIAGAPVYSIDARLATEAWRRLGPRVALWDLRRRVLRRGAMIATLVAGLALIVGSTLGGAVRSSQTAPVPRPGDPPTNQLPGSPLPERPGQGGASRDRAPGGQNLQGTRGGPHGHRSSGPSAAASTGTRHHRGDASTPSQRETVRAPEQSAPGGSPSQTQPGPQPGGSGATGSPGGTGGSSGGGEASGSGSSSSGDGGSGDDGGSSSGRSGGGLGGLLG
jgi:uncharacterized membrane protein YphA (DoxX/SURF4 family)